MATSVFVVTVNGQPLKKVLAAEHSTEINEQKSDEQKQMRFLVAHSRSIISKRVRNHSGARSGRGRIIFQKVGLA